LCKHACSFLCSSRHHLTASFSSRLCFAPCQGLVSQFLLHLVALFACYALLCSALLLLEELWPGPVFCMSDGGEKNEVGWNYRMMHALMPTASTSTDDASILCASILLRNGLKRGQCIPGWRKSIVIKLFTSNMC
jgi:hypothetical protein